VELGFRIPIVEWDSGFLELYSGFQNPGLQIPPAKGTQIPESRFPFMGGLWNRQTATGLSF